MLQSTLERIIIINWAKILVLSCRFFFSVIIFFSFFLFFFFCILHKVYLFCLQCILYFLLIVFDLFLSFLVSFIIIFPFLIFTFSFFCLYQAQRFYLSLSYFWYMFSAVWFDTRLQVSYYQPTINILQP